MAIVLKKGGRRQAFAATKVKRSIERAAKEAGLAASAVKAVVKDVAEPVVAKYKKARTVKASELRKSILGRLDRRAKKVASAWRRYDRKRK